MLEGQFVYQPQNLIIQKTLSLRKTRQSFPLICANATRKAKADSSMRKVLRMAFSWQERLHICGVSKEFKGLTTIENIHIYEL